jgi:hypothetical protein
MHRTGKCNVRIFASLTVSFLLYSFSYAPVLRWCAPDDPVTGSFYYRSPRIFRFVEWATVHTSMQKPLLVWARICGVHQSAELQAWFFAQRINDPTKDIDVSWQVPE